MVQQLFAQAAAFHAAGDARRAEILYRQILSVAPDHTDALHLLGRLALDARNAAAAAELIGRAARLRPRIAEYQASLADAQRALGQTHAALETLRRAARLKPENALIQLNHGVALYDTGQTVAAMQAFRRAVARDPALLAAHRALGSALMAEGALAQAAESFRAALRLAPGDAECLFNLGCALQQAGDLVGAEQQFRAAVAARPDYLQAVNNLGIVLQSAGRLREAAACLRRAGEIDPASPRAFINLGLVLRGMSQFAEAEAAFRRADALDSTAETLCCIGNALRDQAATDPQALIDSEAALTRALARDAGHAEAHIGRAFTRLIGGDLAAAWPDFAWRGAAAIGRARISAHTAAPTWQGHATGTLLIYAEQGAGDFIQMARYVPWAEARAGQVMLLVPPALVRLARSIGGAVAVYTHGDAIPPVDAVCADLDLPGIFETTLATIPAELPYLAADPAAADAWRARLSALPGRKVGLAWAGNPAYAADRQRSVPPEALVALAAVEGVSFVSLQPGAAAPDCLPMVDWTAELTDFAATAALIAALDLTVAVDSAVAHLAGALSRPVWLLNRFAPDWRWLLNRKDTPWYPSMVQYRQTHPEAWPPVIRAVQTSLDVGAN